MKITLTEKQAQTLLWAINLTEQSYEGWSNADKGEDIVKDLACLKRIERKIWTRTEEYANFLEFRKSLDI